MHDADSRYDMTKASTAINDPGADLSRNMDFIYINKKPLSDYSKKYNGFENGKDVLNFFNEVLLKDFEGNAAQRMDAMRNTCLILIQGGILFPTTCAIPDLLKADDTIENYNNKGLSGIISLVVNSNEVKQKTNIITTSKGFTIQNNCGFGKITASGGTKLAKPEYGTPAFRDDYDLTCDKGYDVLIQATGVASVNLLEKEPVIKKEHLQISIGNKGLASYLSPRNVIQAFMDVLKNLLNFNKYPTIEVGKQNPIMTKNQDFNMQSFIKENEDMLIQRNLHIQSKENENLSKQSSKTEEKPDPSVSLETPSFGS